MAQYLVTGGAGFIGSHLSERLLDLGHSVTIYDNLSTGRLENVPARARFIAGDIADAKGLRVAARNCDGIFHLAAVASVQKSHHAWLSTHASNLYGSVAVLEVARDIRPDKPLPVVYASSAAVYGATDQVPIAEHQACNPLSAYGVDKAAVESHARVGGLIHAIPTCGFRFFNVYGPRQDPHSPYSGVISIFTESLLQGRPLVLFGDGGQTRDFVFVGDVVRFLLRGMERSHCDAPVFNVCTGRENTVRRLAELLMNLTGLKADLRNAAPRAGDITRSCGDPSHAGRELGIRATTPLQDGLTATLEHALQSDRLRAA